VIEKALGGSLRLFVQKVYEGSYFTRREETVLTVTANLPNGSTTEQMNRLIGRMEACLSTYREIRQFQTHIYGARQARIDLFFTKESERSGFPYTLKSRIIGKALELGGGSWGVWGLQDQGFSNDVRENAGSFRIEMYGYNYDELYGWAELLREQLLSRPRIKEVLINSEFSWWKDDYQEYYFNLNKARMAQENIRPADLFGTLRPVFGKDLYAGSIVVDNETEKLKLTSRQSKEYDIWSMQYLPVNGLASKLSGLATVEKGQMPQQVAKQNQQYRLCVQYEYIGASNQGGKVQQRILDEFNARLPMGYSARSDSFYWRWGQKDYAQYGLLLLIIVILFFTAGILFNSLRQPPAIIGVIPISYIGVFLTFYWFRLNFDQGGFASFVLLCGITVNAAIYILNEYNALRVRKPLMPPARAYLKAWNVKITPIFLTVISTVLGFIPFMLGEEKEAFWFPLAAGTIGGLLMSVVGIFLYLPVFVLKKESRKRGLKGHTPEYKRH
jgi:multidrug efflux pump subunit AcrB